MCVDCISLDNFHEMSTYTRDDADTDKYRGIVLRQAINIVRHRLRFDTFKDFGIALGVDHRTMMNWHSGRPASISVCSGAFAQLEELVLFATSSAGTTRLPTLGRSL